jgi:hypothetical protein
MQSSGRASRGDALLVREPGRGHHERVAAFLHLVQPLGDGGVEEPGARVLGEADVVAGHAGLRQRHADPGHEVPDEEGHQRRGGRVVPVRGERPRARQRHAERAAGHARQEAHGARDVRVHQRRHPGQRLELPPRAPRRLHEPAPVRRDLFVTNENKLNRHRFAVVIGKNAHTHTSSRQKKIAYMDERPAVAEAEDGVHDAEAAVRAGEHELVLALQEVEPARQDAQRLDGGHEERAQAGAAEVAAQRALEAEAHAGLHPAQVVERDHPARRQVRHVPHHLRRPRQAEHQRQDGEPREPEPRRADHRHAPHGDPREPGRHHQVGGAVEAAELVHRPHRALQHPPGEPHAPGHPARVQARADGERHHGDAHPDARQRGEAHQQRAHGQRHAEAGPDDDAHHGARPRPHRLLPRERQHDAQRHRAFHGRQPVAQQAPRVAGPRVVDHVLHSLVHEEADGEPGRGEVDKEEAQSDAVGVLVRVERRERYLRRRTRYSSAQTESMLARSV